MTALTENTVVPEKGSGWSSLRGEYGGGAIDATARFFKGALICFDTGDGKLKPGETSTTLFAVGKCESDIDPANDGTTSVTVRSGVFGYENSASADLIANDDVGKVCFVVDDGTVALTNGTNTRSAAGIIHSVVDGKVYVAINPDAYLG